jgi:hypothetical protein
VIALYNVASVWISTIQKNEKPRVKEWPSTGCGNETSPVNGFQNPAGKLHIVLRMNIQGTRLERNNRTKHDI